MSSAFITESSPPASRSTSPTLSADNIPTTDASLSHEVDEEVIKSRLLEAEERKQEGTEHFRARRYAEALVAYRSALGLLPRRPVVHAQDKGKGKERAVDASETSASNEDAADTFDTVDSAEEHPEAAAGPANTATSALEQESAKARAVLNANIGACHVKLEEWAEVVTACTEAIADDPTYAKAILRRAQANEKIGSWSALSSAQEDYNKLLELHPKGSAQARDVERALRFLAPRAEAAQKREVDEMFGKLKGIGNTVLGKFGLSTDNFKFEPNGQGGYAMNFVR
ncbi:TPR-like protein [Peniophora sp. CONT]|nr:TPR-like protein [Peniophora sp. CONT]